MDIMTHAKFHFNRLVLTLSFFIRASESPCRVWRMTEKAGPDRVNRSHTTTEKFLITKLSEHRVSRGSII